MKRLAALFLLFLLAAGCAKPPAPAPAPPPSLRPEPAASVARDAVSRPIETGRFLWEEDTVRTCDYPAPGSSGHWYVHAPNLALPGLDGTTVRFCQWRAPTVMARWAVYLRIDRGVTRLFESARLGDELDWYDVVTMPGRPGFALTVGLLNHAGEREWAAVAAVVPHSGSAFGELRAVGAGVFGNTFLGPDRTRLYTVQGEYPTGMEGVVINCVVCPQHLTVTEYTWGEGWELKPGRESRTRQTYLLGSREAVDERPVNPRALDLHRIGTQLIAAGDLDRARAMLSAATSLDPTFPDAPADLGYCHILQQKWAEALPHLEEALRLDQLHPGARFNLALALTRLGRYREAREHVIYAVLLQPGRDEPKALYEEIRRAMGS